jgi:hypothetical protein
MSELAIAKADHMANSIIAATSRMANIDRLSNNHIKCDSSIVLSETVIRGIHTNLNSISNITAIPKNDIKASWKAICAAHIIGNASFFKAPTPNIPIGFMPDSISEENRLNPNSPEYGRPWNVQRSESWGAYQNGLNIPEFLDDQIFVPAPLGGEKIVVERNERPQ